MRTSFVLTHCTTKKVFPEGVFYLDIPKEKWIPTKLEAPTVAKPAPKPAPKGGKQPAAKPAAASSSIPVADGQHVQLFKTMWDQKKKFYTVPVQQ